jgi:hypothetical protein
VPAAGHPGQAAGPAGSFRAEPASAT